MPERLAAAQLSAAGSQVSHDEGAVIELCRRYPDWQKEYFEGEHDGSGRHSFAQKIRSTPGKQDGLFWQETGTSGESPIGPQFARAAFNEEQPEGGPVPYFGYFFKALPIPGAASAGGGSALLAWPAAYGITGRRSFLVSHTGQVYSKDLGSDTPRAAAGMTTFHPDRGWIPLHDEEE